LPKIEKKLNRKEMRKLFILCFLPLVIWCQEHKSPEEIAQELQVAEEQFTRAQEMFNPWYTGPLVTPSATMAAPGQFVIQPYLIVTDNYQRFNSNRTSTPIASSLIQLLALSTFQFGLTDSVDFTITPSATEQWQSAHSGGGFGDLPIALGFLINRESLYVPKMKFTLQESFPTGRYQHLNSNGLALSGLGSGSYQTKFGLAFGKILNWASKHPINSRLFVGYNIPVPVSVEGFNVYGGGFGTKGTVKPGNSWTADVGIEVSLTQRWVAAMDFVYVASSRTKFHGNPGTTAAGEIASVGGPSNDNFSLAPAIEYNWNDSFGLVTGIQFSVCGRNSFNFVSGQFSVYYAFDVK
jgi:hypothetical protein